METENAEPARDSDGPTVGSGQELLTGKSIASAAAVALALLTAVVWSSLSDDAPANDADSAAYAGLDADSASGSSPSTASTTADESPGPEQETESTPGEEHRNEESATPESATDPTVSERETPGTGVYRARQEASGLCMTWGDEPGGDRSVMVLGDCGSTDPELTWIEDGGRYEVEMAFDDWTPCMTVDNGGTEDGMLVGFDGCDGLAAQTWQLVPVGDAYQLRTAASSELCLSVLKSSSAESGDAVAVQHCDDGDAKQQWTLL